MSTHEITYTEVITKKVTKEITIELKHCPFCGGEAELRVGGNYSRVHDRRMGTGVRCKDCKAMTPTREGFDSQLRAAELWNQRAEA